VMDNMKHRGFRFGCLKENVIGITKINKVLSLFEHFI
jgi:hypothetical protein